MNEKLTLQIEIPEGVQDNVKLLHGLSQVCNFYGTVSEWEKALALEYLSNWYVRRAEEKDKKTLTNSNE